MTISAKAQENSLAACESSFALSEDSPAVGWCWRPGSRHRDSGADISIRSVLQALASAHCHTAATNFVLKVEAVVRALPCAVMSGMTGLESITA